MTIVKIYAHNNSVKAGFWLIDNMTAPEYEAERWGINNHWVDPLSWALYCELDKYRTICKLINVNNIKLRKTHLVEFHFKHEEDAIWFKTVWGD